MTVAHTSSNPAPIDDLFKNWRIKNATLLRSAGKPPSRSTDGASQISNSSDLKEALERARTVVREEVSNQKGYPIPLHQAGDPIPTKEYILWRPSSEQVGWYDSSFGISGTVRFISIKSVVGTAISQRVRFWHPEFAPEPDSELDDIDLPDEQVHPHTKSPKADQQAFFTDLLEFVRAERETERQTNWEQHHEAEIEDLVERVNAVGPLIPMTQGTGKDGNPKFTFQIESPEEDSDDEIDLFEDEGIYPNNLYIVDTLGNTEDFPIAAEVTNVSGPTLTLQPDWATMENRAIVEKLLASEQNDFWVRHLLNPIPFDRRLDAIGQVKGDSAKRQLITGNRPVKFSPNQYALPSVEIELNQYQKQALAWADSSADLVCIHGPPGTGKTRTLTAYVKYAVSQGESVLVTAHSNQAVDNLLVGDSTLNEPEPDTLHAFACDDDDTGDAEFTIARVGHNSRNRVVQSNYSDVSVHNADVVAATTSGAAQFDKNKFDVAVVDEATQASRPATAIVMNCAQKIVLAGDHKQLPPYCADESMKTEEMHVSLFEHLLDQYGDSVSVLLRRQYRMNEEIAEFPNQAFYDGKLETAEQNRDWQVDDLKPVALVDIEGDERTESIGNSRYNVAEAEAVAKQVKLLVASGLAPEDIGVISAYRGQIGKIWSQLHRLDIDNVDQVTVDTVDSFQGGEREAIVVSFVRSNPEGNSGFLTFPEEGPRRLNVALTRARKRLILVGNWETLSTTAPHQSEEDGCASIYRELFNLFESKGRVLSTRS